MNMILSSLDQIRSRIRTGDVFAYGAGRGLAQWIESFTDSDQSHVSKAVVQGALLQVVEATVKGSKARLLSKNWKKAADVWWLPVRRSWLKDGTYDVASELVFLADVCERRVPYDFAALRPRVWRGGRPPEDYSRLYCSELAALGFRRAGVYNGTAELTPIEVCRLAVYEPDYYCLKWGEEGPKEIDGYNTVDPGGDAFLCLEPVF